MTGFSLGLTVACIVMSFLAGMMMNEAGHHRRRARSADDLATQARRARALIRMTWGR